MKLHALAAACAAAFLLGGCVTNPQQPVAYGVPQQQYYPVAQAGQYTTYGKVDSIMTVTRRPDGGYNVIGPVAGALAGAAVGNQFGKGSGKKAMTILGAVGGAFAGNAVQNQVQAGQAFEIRVRLNDGQMVTTVQDQINFGVGQPVRVVSNNRQIAVYPM